MNAEQILAWRMGQRRKELSLAQRYAPDGWLEEDCDWALAAFAFPELFEPKDCYYAVKTFSADGEYYAPTRAWLATPAAKAVHAKAALYVPETLNA